MTVKIQEMLASYGPVLCVDIGAQTQKALLARASTSHENWPAFLLPAPASRVAQRIYEATLLKKDVWLYGQEMGGGFLHAIRDHLRQGLKVHATEKAARSLHNSLEVVTSLGINIADSCPAKAIPVHCSDFCSEYWYSLLRNVALPQPHLILAAVQDHGAELYGSREARLEYWRKQLLQDPDPVSWIHEQAPAEMRRLLNLQEKTGGPVADTATCSILGAIANPQVSNRSFQEGITFLNVGNAHTLGALIFQNHVHAILEHHTETQTIQYFPEQLKQFKLRWLPPESFHAHGGTGPAYLETGAPGESFEPVFITGPRREILRNYGVFINPEDMALFGGCYGLLYGWAKRIIN